MNDTLARQLKDELFGQFARITKALASPKRLEIIDVLAQGERTVERLAHEINQSVANTSQHLQTLKSARLVEVRREGLYAHYRLTDEQVFEVWKAIRSLGERRLAEIDRVVDTYLNDRDSLEKISASELLARLERNEVTLLDVRPTEEYQAGHLPGALSVPINELPDRLAEIPQDRPVIAYCRGPFCILAVEAVETLRQRGFSAQRMESGVPEWRLAGYPIATEQN